MVTDKVIISQCIRRREKQKEVETEEQTIYDINIDTL